MGDTSAANSSPAKGAKLGAVRAVLDRRRFACELGDRRDSVIGDATRHDEVEAREIGRHVEGETHAA